MNIEKKEYQKQTAAKGAVSYVRDGMTIGLGTGSTVYYLIRELAALAESGMKLRAVATSVRSQKLAVSCGIPVCGPNETDHIDLAIDGVDEIDSGFCAVKGGGGALLREKIVASQAEDVIWIMDESKLVERLGNFPLPVEVLPFGASWAAEEIKKAGGIAELRKKNGQIFYTDNGNYILDVTLKQDAEYRTFSDTLGKIPGVLETGYFDRICSRIIVGTDDGAREVVNLQRCVGYPQKRGEKI